MGIDVHGKVVKLNPHHERRVVTDPRRPIPFASFGSLHVQSIFRRRRVKHDDDDGNPLIYALKGRFGYTIAHADLRELVKAGRMILPAAMNGLPCDMVVPLPSSSSVTTALAKRVARQAGGRPVVPCLDKATIAQVLAQAPAPSSVTHRDRNAYTSQLARLQALPRSDVIEMKSVAMHVRPYFVPTSVNALASGCVGCHIILVDDIVGSGTTLISAQKALLTAGAASVQALTLLSQLR